MSRRRLSEDVDQWSTLLFLFTLSALPSYARQDETGFRSRRDVARSDAPDAAALVAGVLSVLHRLDANAAEGLRPDGSEAPEDKTSFVRALRPERCDFEASRTDFEPGFEREPVSDQDEETEQKKVVGPFVSAYLGCLARHLRRFASRRGATAARGIGTAPSSIAGAFSAALDREARDGERRGNIDERVRGRRRRAAAAEASACAEWLGDGVPAGDDSETRAVRARAAVRAGQRVDALGRVVFITLMKKRGNDVGITAASRAAHPSPSFEFPRNRLL